MKLTTEEARLIANSQADLGGISKDILTAALVTGYTSDLKDPISKTIALAILDASDKEEALSNLKYTVDELNRAWNAINTLKLEEA